MATPEEEAAAKAVADKAAADAKAQAEADAKRTYDQAYVTRLKNEAAESRTQADAIAKERDALAKEKSDREKVELEAKGEYEKARTKLEKEAKERDDKYAADLAARDKRLVVAEAKASAIKAGIIDPTDVETLDFSDLKADDADLAKKIDAKIDAAKTAKAHWFGTATQTEAQRRAGASPGSGGGGGGKGAFDGVDWAKVPDAERDAKIAEFMESLKTL